MMSSVLNSEWDGDEDLSCDAAPTMNSTPGELGGNQPDDDQESYSFVSQLFSPRERHEYSYKIKLIKNWFNLEEFGDVLMLCSEEDNEDAGKYCKYLRTLQMRGGPGQSGVNVKASLMENEVLPGQSVFSGPEKSLARFTFDFLYITSRTNKNDLYSFYQDMCLAESVQEEQKEGCLAVVYTDGVNLDDIPLQFQGEIIIRASDRSKDTKNALIKKLESKLYLREAKEKKFIEEKFEEAEELENS
ncbi:uncharacterized protein LOC110465008 [Mizuhopecten yessoensis]|uniref:Uncharacterized protein n=1 Tax=Mizuhopecten yessoensis TaxID=6573 RepID=A0A210PSM5_MIZYE|nr:uncharacterized protein LOC110465008 [Mizuhopecten yessoensis]OWF39464.1 hypothetical protein KP79_PYT19864 [Mizuhopecten yessoensis]